MSHSQALDHQKLETVPFFNESSTFSSRAQFIWTNSQHNTIYSTAYSIALNVLILNLKTRFEIERSKYLNLRSVATIYKKHLLFMHAFIHIRIDTHLRRHQFISIHIKTISYICKQNTKCFTHVIHQQHLFQKHNTLVHRKNKFH